MTIIKSRDHSFLDEHADMGQDEIRAFEISQTWLSGTTTSQTKKTISVTFIVTLVTIVM